MSVVVPDWTPHAPLQRLRLPWSEAAGVELAVLRLDLIDPLISGNKWFKLSHHLARAQDESAAGVISLGGAHSNHLHALASAGKRFGFATVGLLRGHAQQTATVDDLLAFGMQLHWLGYAGYRARHAADFWRPWQARYPGFYQVPEGGGGLPGALGCMALLPMMREQLAEIGWADYDAWWLAAGTGTTLAGLLLAEAAAHPVHGALAVPADHGVAQQVQQIVLAAAQPVGHYHLHEACRGGFARSDAELLAFMHDAENHIAMPLEPLYTSKALMALRQQVEAGYFARGSRVVFVHTGGLQGRASALSSSASLL